MSTQALIAFLDKSRSARSTTQTVSQAPAPSLAPATVAFSSITSIVIDALHDTKVDPDRMLLLSARDAKSFESLSEKLLPILAGRQESLTAHLEEAGKEAINVSTKVKALWKAEVDTLEESRDLLSRQQDRYLKASAEIWEGPVKDVLLLLEKEITGPLVLGS